MNKETRLILENQQTIMKALFTIIRRIDVKEMLEKQFHETGKLLYSQTNNLKTKRAEEKKIENTFGDM